MANGRWLQVKAVLQKSPEDARGMNEIRRFRLEMEENGGVWDSGRLLQSLQTQVHSVFSLDPCMQSFTLFWKDEDDDPIQFSSGEELRHAVDNMSDSTLRIYVTVASKESATQGSEENTTRGDNIPSGASFYVPPPPPPPFHPHAPPRPFFGPWARGGWRRWGPMGQGRWKGGWKGGLFYGCPWVNGREGFTIGRKSPLSRLSWKKKIRRMMNTRNSQGVTIELNAVEKHVAAEFRNWVHRYVSVWHIQGPQGEGTQLAAIEKLPEVVGQDFRQWLPSFLDRNYSPGRTPQPWYEEMQDTYEDFQMENAPDCLPPLYFQWLCLFLHQFFHGPKKHAESGTTSDCKGGEGMQFPGGYNHTSRQGFCAMGGFGWPGKHGSCKKNKGGKHGKCNPSSESEDSDGCKKAWRGVPKGLRKFVRMSFKQLRKGKGDSTKIREKAARAGVSKEVQDFVEQVMLEWSAKVSSQPQHAVAAEMMAGERTLPSGMERNHFVWMVRFMGRWDAGKWGTGKRCFWRDWLTGGSATDESSEEEAMPEGQGCGPCPPYTPNMGPMGSLPFMGMAGAPPHGFPGFPGMDDPFTPPPPPPMYGCFPPPPPPPSCFPPAYMFEFPDQGAKKDNSGDGKGCKEDNSDSETSSSSAEMVDVVTEGVKKM